MKKNILYTIVLTTIAILTSACSNGKVLHAPNGKEYYIDSDGCEIYTLDRDSLYCYDSDNKMKKVYKPVSFGYEIQTREGY